MSFSLMTAFHEAPSDNFLVAFTDMMTERKNEESTFRDCFIYTKRSALLSPALLLFLIKVGAKFVKMQID